MGGLRRLTAAAKVSIIRSAAPFPSAEFPKKKNPRCRSVAQSGSALAWGARGPEFKSRRSDQSKSVVYVFARLTNGLVRRKCILSRTEHSEVDHTAGPQRVNHCKRRRCEEE